MQRVALDRPADPGPPAPPRARSRVLGWLAPAWWVALGWVALAGWTAAWAIAQSSPSGISWHFFADGSKALLVSSGLHTYADQPTLQIGPLALLAAGALVAVAGSHALVVAQVLMTLGLLVAFAVLTPSAPARHRHVRVLLAGAVTAPAWTVLSVRWAHLDDALALVLLTVAVGAVGHRGGHPVLAGLAVAGACAAKPWAVIGLPLLLVPNHGRWRAFLYAAGGTALAWAPFVVADHATVAALRPRVRVADSSVMWWLGYRGTYLPPWDRLAQLLGAPLAALLAVARGAWPGALLAGIAVRLLLDPQDLPYYAAGAVLAAAVADLYGHHSRVPWLALGTSAALWQPFVLDYATRFETSNGLPLWWFQHPAAVAALHTGWAVAALLVALWWLPRLQRHRA